MSTINTIRRRRRLAAMSAMQGLVQLVAELDQTINLIASLGSDPMTAKEREKVIATLCDGYGALELVGMDEATQKEALAGIAKRDEALVAKADDIQQSINGAMKRIRPLMASITDAERMLFALKCAENTEEEDR